MNAIPITQFSSAKLTRSTEKENPQTMVGNASCVSRKGTDALPATARHTGRFYASFTDVFPGNGDNGWMKTTLIACFCLGSFAQALEVHEWGTFTVLSGSNGVQVPWYASQNDIARLPDFVRPAFGSKFGFAAMRMETPVIYFYPEKETKVTVEVSFDKGGITETFPHSTGGIKGFDPASGMILMDGKWTGTLRPPTDKKALAAIPAIVETDHSEPYGAAREVPDAWIFESDLKGIPGLEGKPPIPQIEKFIFYRGAGNAYLPVSASIDGDVATVRNDAVGALDYAVALRVRDGKAGWVAIPPVAGRPAGGETAMNESEVTFAKPDRSLDEVESELALAWKKAFADDGLTPAEASAMVETWRMTWFRESGDRILTLVPHETIDAMLPLKISPSPAKTRRVFVARIELIAPAREQALIALLNSVAEPGEEEFAAFERLEMGRFGHGALDIATKLQAQRMQGKFYGLKNFGENRKISGRSE